MVFLEMRRLKEWLFFVGLILVAIAREPRFFTAPRIWAEEGNVHIQAVLSNGLWESLVMPHLGYYSLFNNCVVAFGVGVLGLDKVAYATTLLSFVVMMMTVWSPFVLKSIYWDTYFKKVVIVVFSLLVSPAEIWLNTINAQFYFCVFACYLLLSDTRSIRGWKLAYVLFLFLNGVFTGVTTLALAPFFVYKFIKLENRSAIDFGILIVFVVGVLVQFSALVVLALDGSVTRFSLSYLNNLPSGFINNLLVVFRGKKIFFLSIVLLCAVLFFVNRSKINRYLLPLFVSVYLSFIFAFLSFYMQGGARYGYVSAVMIFVFLVNFLFCMDRFYLIAAAMLITVFLSVLYKFFDTNHVYNHSWSAYSVKNVQVGSDGEKYIKVFPQVESTNWRIVVSDENLKQYK